MTAQLQTGVPARVQVMAWETTLVAAVLARDVRLAKAYGVGRQLNLTAYSEPPGDFRSATMTGLADALDDLTSSLPTHAARGVAGSIPSVAADTRPTEPRRDGGSVRAVARLAHGREGGHRSARGEVKGKKSAVLLLREVELAVADALAFIRICQLHPNVGQIENAGEPVQRVGWTGGHQCVWHGRTSGRP